MSDQIERFMSYLESTEEMLEQYQSTFRTKQAEIEIFSEITYTLIPYKKSALEGTLVSVKTDKKVSEKSKGLEQDMKVLSEQTGQLINEQAAQFINDPVDFLKTSRHKVLESTREDYEALKKFIATKSKEGVKGPSKDEDKVDDVTLMMSDHELFERGKRIIQQTVKTTNDIKLAIELCCLPKIIIKMSRFLFGDHASEEWSGRLLRLQLGRRIGDEINLMKDLISKVVFVTGELNRHCNKCMSYLGANENNEENIKDTKQSSFQSRFFSSRAPIATNHKSSHQTQLTKK